MGKHMRAEKVKKINKTEKENPNTGRKVKHKSKKISGFLMFVLIIILCDAIVSGCFAPVIKNKIDKLGGGASGVIAFLMGHDENTRKNLGTINILLIGESGVDDYKLADTMMICSYDVNNQKAALLSIPRDTYVGSYQTATSAYYKINARYKSGNEMDVLLNDLENITGLKIKYYIRVSTNALVKLVDLVGGVDFEVPINMDYDDPTQNLHIHLKAGYQHITGEKAEQLLRFRHSNNGNTYSFEYGSEDFGRMKTQRAFIEQTLKQTIKPSNINKINELVEVGYKNIVTNIELEKILDYVPYIMDFNVDNLKQDVLPGYSEPRDGIWIYTYDRDKTQQLIKDMFLSNEETEVDGQA